MGFEDDLKRMAAKVSEWCDIKVSGILGNDAADTKWVTILNRGVKVTDEGLEYTAAY